jgi:hypothetical protein
MAKITGNKKHIENLPEYKDFVPDLDIEVQVSGDYEVYSKPLPEPTPHPDGGTIKWFNAFGVRQKGGSDADVKYKVTLQKLPPGKKLYYLAKNQKDFYEIKKLVTVDDKRVSFELSIGDPPTGAYP